MLKTAMQNTQNYTLTENGAITHRSTKSHVLDLFALGAAANGINLDKMIRDAIDENPVLAIKVIFNLSDIREGQGRRDFFRQSLRIIMEKDADVARKLLAYIPEFGRWDYLYWFMGTELQKDALSILRNEVIRSIKEEKISLVFKWLASADASSAETKKNAAITRKAFNLTPKEYRKMLSKGRKMLGEAIVETKMSARQWNTIDYSKVPSVATKRYRKAFNLHSPEKFVTFIKKVQTGEAKINSSVLYPSDIIHAGINSSSNKGVERAALVEQWKALPNYLSPEVRALAVVDTSGSMRGLPLEVATSLGMYLADRMTGEFHNSIISFSATAKIFDLPRGDIFDKYAYLERQNICENTNLQSVFDLILNSAIRTRVPAEQMPNRIVVISDMEFDPAGGYNWNSRTRTPATNLDVIRQKYAAAGYEFPQIIYWNVDARNHQSPATMNDQGVILVSGYSPVIMKSVLSNDPYITPYKAMLQTVDVKRYAFINEIITQDA